MKGYAVLTLIVSLVLLSMPPLILEVPEGQEATAVDDSETVTVLHTDGGGQSEISLYDLTLYETAAWMSPQAPSEALKAQALACRTQFCYQRLTQGEADVTATAQAFPAHYTATYWQEQWGEQYETNMTNLRAAVSAVFGQTITYESQPIMALTHTMNSGMTENASVLLQEDIPYLCSVASPADALSTEQLSIVSVPLDTAREKLTSLLGQAPPADAQTWFADVRKTDAGTVTSLTVAAKSLTGQQLQEAFLLPSAAFEMSVQADSVIFTVHGKGHFVGLSTVGAVAMAKDGQNYKQILQHYYTGVTIA